jgi:hypothetical protein
MEHRQGHHILDLVNVHNVVKRVLNLGTFIQH